MEKPYQLIVRRPGSLESVVLDREIDLEEYSLIENVLANHDRIVERQAFTDEEWTRVSESERRMLHGDR